VLDQPLCHAKFYPRFSAEWCRQNLRRLAGAQLLRATPLRVWHDAKSRSGRIPFLYSLTPDGADVVEVATGVVPRYVLRSDPTPTTFHHRLAIVRVRIAFEIAAERAGLSPPTFVIEQDVRPDAPGEAMPQQRSRLHQKFESPEGRVIICRPDASAVLRIPHPSGDGGLATDLAILVEADRSTEGIAQCERKLPGYSVVFERKKFSRFWTGLRNPVYRVFWIVPSPERIKTLSAAFRGKPVAEFFRFSTFADCQADRILTEAVWRDCSGKAMPLYRGTGRS
jgi:hypothetical protein